MLRRMIEAWSRWTLRHALESKIWEGDCTDLRPLSLLDQTSDAMLEFYSY